MRNTSFGIALGLGSGIMNAIPWGGPTMRAATVLEMDVMEFWIPFIPTQIFGMVVALIICIFIGIHERKRLIAEGILSDKKQFNIDEFTPKYTKEEMEIPLIVVEKK